MDVRRRLGAREGTGTVLVVLFVPSTDRNGRPIDHVLWVTHALEVFGRLFRGATAYPRARGVWRDDARGGALLYDEPTIIQCYAERAALESGLTDLRAFLHRMGRETRQGEVGIVIDGQYFGINRYDDS